jgi:hypothetical protein
MKQFLILCIIIALCGCIRENRNDDRIYEVLSFVIEDQNLDKNYGLTLTPEYQIDDTKSNKEFLLSLLESKNTAQHSTGSDRKQHFLELKVAIEYNFSLDKCLSPEDVEGMLYQLSSASNFSWDNNRLKFNLSNKENWYVFSPPLFSKDGTTAVMMVRHLCRGLCGSGWQLMLKKENGKWTSQRGITWHH